MISKACVAATYQVKLAEIARCPDVELHVVVPPYWREGRSRLWLERAHVRGYQMHVAPLALNGQFHLHFYPTLGRLMRQIAPDIVHIDEEPYNLATWQAMRLARRAGAQALFFTWQNLLRRYAWPFSALERYNYAQTAYAIAGNAEAEQVLRAKGYRGPVEVLPQFGVDPEIYRPAEGPATNDVLTIGYVGRLVPEKGVDLLLRAAAGLGGEWRLRIIGDGPERAALQGLAAELGLGERVEWVARVPFAQVPAEMARLDVLALPSRTRPNWKEQFGRVLVEAMSCEVPVIGSDSGEIPHVLGETGLVFPEGDAAALGRCLELVRDEPNRRGRWGRPGRQRVLERYTQAHVAQRTCAIYGRMREARQG